MGFADLQIPGEDICVGTLVWPQGTKEPIFEGYGSVLYIHEHLCSCDWTMLGPISNQYGETMTFVRVRDLLNGDSTHFKSLPT